MTEYILQYSRPGKNKIAISDWKEYITTIKANSQDEAIKKFNHNQNGTWYILDCYKK